LAREKTISGCWAIDVGELEASEADAAVEGRTKSKSEISAGSHRFLQQMRVCDFPLPGAPTVGVL
jgi:hypothetical protein